MTLAHGVDISSAQKVTSWSSLRSSLGANGFVIVKATEGRTFVSPTWSKYWAAAGAAKILRGSYHFARPVNSPATEAANYVAQLRAVGFKSGRDLPPMLDLEDRGGRTSAELTTWARTFLAGVDGALGLRDPWLRCGVYLNRWYRSTYTDGSFLVGRVTWFAQWGSNRTTWPTDAARDAVGTGLWQWSDRKTVGGISTPCDADVARPADLRSMAPAWFGAPVPVPVPVPPAPPVVELIYANPHKRTVAALQRALNVAVGSDCHGGYHDAKTAAAVRAWQTKLGHRATGYMTPAEFAELGQKSKMFTVKAV